MPGLLFSGANAALVAYGEVVGATGSVVIDSENTTAGQVTVTRNSTGKYTLTLPTGYGQSQSRSMVFCSPRATSPAFIGIDVSASQQKVIYTYDSAATAADVNFSFMIFENTEPKPVL
jgi:hypothetical protein